MGDSACQLPLDNQKNRAIPSFATMLGQRLWRLIRNIPPKILEGMASLYRDKQ
jgi:hypothetical protein